VTITATVRDSDGAFVKNATRTAAANSFEQVSLAAFLGNITPPAGGSVQISMGTEGPITFYVSTTDNRTNDSSMKQLKFR
jgi:hypothetical protein